ncbi:hypothetical protein KSP40_PGU022824 [Platanthera guangdongensis]|uniref:Uncharacterized protein n=1 Tax=Platanthera guangdongensis TaxID=2320717 RepID=A0ABR2LQ76_9ASPA
MLGINEIKFTQIFVKECGLAGILIPGAFLEERKACFRISSLYAISYLPECRRKKSMPPASRPEAVAWGPGGQPAAKTKTNVSSHAF